MVSVLQWSEVSKQCSALQSVDYLTSASQCVSVHWRGVSELNSGIAISIQQCIAVHLSLWTI